MTVPSIESEHLVRSGIDIDHLGKMTPVWMQNAFKLALWMLLLGEFYFCWICLYIYNILYMYIYTHIQKVSALTAPRTASFETLAGFRCQFPRVLLCNRRLVDLGLCTGPWVWGTPSCAKPCHSTCVIH